MYVYMYTHQVYKASARSPLGNSILVMALGVGGPNPKTT